ncbi:hypothetical protein AMEX_G23352 [Astyanax mexicanus]|uniref:Uncharacterized protein n=1 Tax=Astyanax mexicanus TaxID=7994 RepID=A0A8T2KXF2_ASTMX|nr:hypothetical protein AMEX_G23352 [Astyanax mexicanus]
MLVRLAEKAPAFQRLLFSAATVNKQPTCYELAELAHLAQLCCRLCWLNKAGELAADPGLRVLFCCGDRNQRAAEEKPTPIQTLP